MKAIDKFTQVKDNYINIYKKLNNETPTLTYNNGYVILNGNKLRVGELISAYNTLVDRAIEIEIIENNPIKTTNMDDTKLLVNNLIFILNHDEFDEELFNSSNDEFEKIYKILNSVKDSLNKHLK